MNYSETKIDLRLGKCEDVLPLIPDNSIDAIITDPPYGISFMGKSWDHGVPSKEIWKECLRVLKPGGYLLAFAGTRTQHRMASNIEDAGFEIRDMIAWVYGSGFPKSHNIGKSIDELQGNEREIVGDRVLWGNNAGKGHGGFYQNEYEGASGQKKTAVVTSGNSIGEGWGTALKPALEPITVARKPLSEKTVAENFLRWGTGGINIDGSRIDGMVTTNPLVRNVGGFGSNGLANQENPPQSKISHGRWPANLIHDGDQLVLDLFPESKSQGHFNSKVKMKGHTLYEGGFNDFEQEDRKMNDSGSAARFFYCAKASRSERNAGCEDEENNHPTVKPIKLMEYLVNLVTRESATVLDPFLGSGTTAIACNNFGRNIIGIEQDEHYIEISKNRIKYHAESL